MERRYYTQCDTSIKEVLSKPTRTIWFQSKKKWDGWNKQSDKAKLEIEGAIVDREDTDQVKKQSLSLFDQQEPFN